VHITELRLHGFKSFVDPARAPIADGLTGVVGPNGCGKSNLLEAVRWVMGATSAKSMRAGDMEDVIFAGSAGRPAREFAEVVVVLADAAGRAPAPFHTEETLEISRRIRRGHGSTYRINGKEVRAKDVQLLFADAATGANSPALVRQGQVSELIAAKPANRRRILEDAAGVAGLHARRHEADLKLNAAATNLNRLDEILAEIEGQAASLKKQARQAERYRGLAQTLRETEALLLHRRWLDARERTTEAQEKLRACERASAEAAAKVSAAARAAEAAQDALGPLREEETVAAGILRQLEGVRVGLDRDIAEADAAIARCDEDRARAGAEATRVEALKRDAEAAIARLGEEAAQLGDGDDQAEQAALMQAQATLADANANRAEAEAALDALNAAAAAANAQARATTEAATTAKVRLVRLEERTQVLEAQRAALPTPDRFDAGLTAAAKALNEAKAAQEASTAALLAAEKAVEAALKEEQAAFAPYRDAESKVRELEAEVRALTKLAPETQSEFLPVLKAVRVTRGFERALAAALGDDLDAALDARALTHWGGAETHDQKLPEGAEPLAKKVKAPEALSARLALVGVVDADQGARLAKHLAPGMRLVSRAGDLWRWDGFVRRAEAPLPAAARLEQQERLAEARTELETAQILLAQAKAAHDEKQTARLIAETEARARRAEAPGSANSLIEAQRALERLELDQTRAIERAADLAAQSQALAAERAEARETLSIAEAAVAAANAARLEERAIADARTATEEARRLAAEASAQAQGLARERAQREARRKAVTAEQAQWTARLTDAGARLQTLAQELVALAKQRKAAEAAPVEARAKLAKLMEDTSVAEARRKAAGDKVAEAEAQARIAAETVRTLDQAHASARELRAGAEVQAQAAEARVADIEAHAREQAGVAPEALLELAGGLASSALASGPLPDLERRFDRLKAERDAAGPVNLRAEEELAEAQARIEDLSREKEDVVAAVAKLRRAISALNNEGRARLLKAFEQVDAHFAQLFATLFEGGQANLKLTESEDPLEAGLEIFAQPPGKRLSTLSLLSGGEQALTATALIFAVFLANPAPLCVLDEVDAPLDDANVDRFCRMLEAMKGLTSTRFMVITHNPVTMARMDRLYGVTMPEHGASQLVSVDLGVARKLAAE
jgi:chromosome segregation protein